MEHRQRCQHLKHMDDRARIDNQDALTAASSAAGSATTFLRTSVRFPPVVVLLTEATV